jgi:hypothetical protein
MSRIGPHRFRPSRALSREAPTTQQRLTGRPCRRWCAQCGLPETNATAHPDTAQPWPTTPAEATELDRRRLGEHRERTTT